ncbi:MAG: NAD(P)H-dependent oxidoreductase subunit E, partial [Nitrospirales bacterium]
MLLSKFQTEVEEILSRYPVKRSALLPLLNLAQREDGFVSESAMRDIAKV